MRFPRPDKFLHVVALDELATRFRNFGSTSATRAPLYGRISAAVAEDRAVVSLLHAAPEEQQLPVLLLAAVHHLLLEGAGPELAAHYPNLSTTPPRGDAGELFRAFALSHAERVRTLVATRSTQTNEVGRCAQFIPAFGLLADECGALAHIDVGASAGLNLLLPRYQYEFEPGGVVGDPSTVRLHCATRGDVPVPASLPRIAHAVGLDRSPIDVMDDDAVRWLEACVWPDQADRFARLVAAISIARQHPPEVHTGDAVADLSGIVRGAAAYGHPVVTNSWVLNYLPHDARLRYVEELDRLGADADLSWVLAESPAQTPGLPIPTTVPAEEVTVLSVVRWRQGVRTVQRLATTHPHGFWLRWEH